jgi:hypothetical protein
MFTVFIDDSGTDPNQRVAIATALIIPAERLTTLEGEWNRFKEKEGFTDFHTSLCVASNPKSEFANWNDSKRKRVLARVRRIGKKFGAQAISFAVDKSDYDQVVPSEIRQYAGQYHYTWAMRSLISTLEKWAKDKGISIPFEYIFDWMDPKAQKQARAEIETVMAQAEEQACERGEQGRFVNYSFRCRKDIPGLQCTDLLAWTCYQFALSVHEDIPLSETARSSWNDYYFHLNKRWLWAVGIKREHLEDWVGKELADGKSLARFKQWQAKQAEKHADV